MNIVNKIVEDDRTTEDLRKVYPEENKISEESLLNYIVENDLKILKTGFLDKWKYLTKKLAVMNTLTVSKIIKVLLTI